MPLPVPSIIRSLSNREKQPPPSERDLQLESTRSKVSFTTIKVHMETLAYSQTRTSHNHYSTPFPYQSRTYTLPKCLEGVKIENVHLMLWTMKDEKVFGDWKFEHWEGKYCVWYRPCNKDFYLTKVRDDIEEGGTVGYLDVPRVQQRDRNFWFGREMGLIRDELLRVYGTSAG